MEWGQYLWELGPGTRGGLKLRMPSQFKETASETKRSACCFWRHFLEAQVKNEDCCSSTCQLVPHSQPSDSPSGLNSVRVSKVGTRMLYKGPLRTVVPPSPVTTFSKSPKYQKGCSCTSEPKPDMRCIPPSNFSKRCLSVAQTHFGWGAHGERTRRRGVEDMRWNHKTLLQSSSPPVQ